MSDYLKPIIPLHLLVEFAYGYGLFICNGNTFYSSKLNEVMKLFEQRRAKIEAYKRNKKKEKLLEISDVCSGKSDIVSFEVKGKVTTSKEEKKSDAVVPISLAWERYVDELAHEQGWIEIMAMRSDTFVW